jgi:hypothetical protein
VVSQVVLAEELESAEQGAYQHFTAAGGPDKFRP